MPPKTTGKRPVHDARCAMPRSTTASPWARYEPTPDDPWDLRKVGPPAPSRRVRRDAGGAAPRPGGRPRGQRRAAVPSARAAARGRRGDRRPAPDGAVVVEPRPAQGLLAQPHPPRAGPAPREADPVLARPFRHQQQEGRVGHPDGPAERDAAHARPGRVRRHARGHHRRPGHAGLARRRQQQEGQAQRELRPRVPRAVHPGRRALSASATSARPRGPSPAGCGRIRAAASRRPRPSPTTPRRSTTGPKTFLGLNGPWGPSDIVRITLERPEAATFLARKLYRWFVSESGTPGPELIEPLAEEVKATPVRHRADRGGHPAIEALLLPRGVSPADQVAGRVQRGPGADARGAARRRSTRWRCRPRATRRARSCSPRPTSRAGSAARSGSTAAPCWSAPTGPPTSSGADPRTA